MILWATLGCRFSPRPVTVRPALSSTSTLSPPCRLRDITGNIDYLYGHSHRDADRGFDPDGGRREKIPEFDLVDADEKMKKLKTVNVSAGRSR
jgi:hypothetical protein